MDEKVIMKRFGITGDGGLPVNLDKGTQGIQNLLKYDEIDAVMDFYGIERIMKYAYNDGIAEPILWRGSSKFIKRFCLIDNISPKHKDTMVKYFIKNGDISNEEEFDEIYDKMKDKRVKYGDIVQYTDHKSEVEEKLKEINQEPKEEGIRKEFNEFKKTVDDKFDVILGLLQKPRREPKVK